MPRQTRHSRAIFLIPLLLVTFAGAPASPQTPGSFEVNVDPPLSQLEAAGNPDSEKVLSTVTVTVKGSNGRPLEDVLVELGLTAPAFGGFIRSDIPRIEGRQLVQTQFLAPDGTYSFQYVWPIRGDYQLDLTAAPAPGSGASFTPFSDRLTLAVGERGGEALRFLFAIGALFLFGALSALVLVKAQRLREGPASGAPAGRPAGIGRAPSGAGLLGTGLVILVLLLVAFFVVQQVEEMRADNEVAGYEGAGKGESGQVASGGVVLEYHLSRSSDEGIGVQTLLTTSGTVKDAGTGQPVPRSAVRLEAVDLEGGEVVFATEGITPDGHFTWRHTFWDGIEYDLNLSALPGESPLRFAPVSRRVEIAVAPMSPPLASKLIGFGYTMAAFVAGIAATLLLTRRRGRRPLAVNTSLPRLDPRTP